jgi:hypothetical protein
MFHPIKASQTRFLLGFLPVETGALSPPARDAKGPVRVLGIGGDAGFKKGGAFSY